MPQSQQNWTTGPQLTGLEPVITALTALLRGRLEVQPGVAIETEREINLSIRLVDDTIYVQFIDPKPKADLNFVFRLRRDIDALKLTPTNLAISIQGLPDPQFDILS